MSLVDRRREVLRKLTGVVWVAIADGGTPCRVMRFQS
jgi:hypothetical protein